MAPKDAQKRAQKRQQRQQVRPGQQGQPKRSTTDIAVQDSANDVSLLIRAQAAEIASLVTPRTGRPGIESDTHAVQKVLAALMEGNYRITACRLAGISPQTLHNVMSRAEQGEVAARAFVDAIESAEAFAEREMVNCVRSAAKAGPQFWAAGMTYLERRAPERWGKRMDDSQTPRVVVQIGTQHGTQDVNIITSALPQSPQLTD